MKRIKYDQEEIKFLQKEGGKQFVQIYRMIFQLDIIRSYVTRKITAYGPQTILVVIHSKGQFSFPFKRVSISDTVEAERRIREIFYKALNMPFIQAQQQAA